MNKLWIQETRSLLNIKIKEKNNQISEKHDNKRGYERGKKKSKKKLKNQLTEKGWFGNINEHLARGRRSLKTKQEEKHKYNVNSLNSYSKE